MSETPKSALVAVKRDEALAVVWTEHEIETIKRTYCKGATDAELHLFAQVCNRTKLDPFARQIFAIKRKEKDRDTGAYREVLSIQTSIDGFRLIAERTGRYEGQLGPFWCGPDGEWLDVWLANLPPSAAKVGVLKAGFRAPLWGVAVFASYAQTFKDGNLMGL